MRASFDALEVTQNTHGGVVVVGWVQVEMGMSYEELSWFGRLRKVHRCGPVSMFRNLVYEWSDLPPSLVAEKVSFPTFPPTERERHTHSETELTLSSCNTLFLVTAILDR